MSQSESVRRECADLVLNVRRGSKQDEEKFVKSYRGQVFAMLKQLVRDEARAEDLTQESLLHVIQKLRSGGVREAEKLESYLFSTARFMYFGWLRKRDNQLRYEESMEDAVSSDLPMEVCVMNVDRRNLIDEAMECLKVSRDREILERHYLWEQSKDEVCDALLLSTQHYDRVLSRARKRLKPSISMELL